MPSYYELEAFGSQCFPRMRAYNKHKLELRALECVFLGYCSNHKGYLCLYVSTNKIITSMHVIFNEKVFPFPELVSTSLVSTVSSPSIISVLAHFPVAKPLVLDILILGFVTTLKSSLYTLLPIISSPSLPCLPIISSFTSESLSTQDIVDLPIDVLGNELTIVSLPVTQIHIPSNLNKLAIFHSPFFLWSL